MTELNLESNEVLSCVMGMCNITHMHVRFTHVWSFINVRRVLHNIILGMRSLLYQASCKDKCKANGSSKPLNPH